MKLGAGIGYLESGQGEVPIVCLHGIGGAAASFRPQLDGLETFSRIVSWDMPGYGTSEPVSPVTFQALTDKLDEFLVFLGIDRVHLMGHSVGGMIATDYALRFPDKVASLILVATTSAFGGRDDSFRDRFLEMRLSPLEAGKSMKAIAEKLVPDMVGSIATPEVISNAVDFMAAVPTDTYRGILNCLVTFNRREEIEKITCPVCLIAGSADMTAPAQTMERMAAKLPDAEFHVVEGAGHLVNMEAPERTNEILTEFMKMRFSHA